MQPVRKVMWSYIRFFKRLQTLASRRARSGAPSIFTFKHSVCIQNLHSNLKKDSAAFAFDR